MHIGQRWCSEADMSVYVMSIIRLQCMDGLEVAGRVQS